MDVYGVQGVVKGALRRVMEVVAARQQELLEQSLALQERCDSLAHTLTERTEENATTAVEVRSLAVAKCSNLIYPAYYQQL